MRSFLRALALAFILPAMIWAADFLWLYSKARATVTSASSSITLLGNGSTTVFSFPFVGVAASDIVVTYTDTTGAQTVLNPVNYTLALAAPAAGQIWGIGGTVTYPLAGPAIANGTLLTIQRTLPYTQQVSSNQGQRFALSIEAALDTLAMQIQQVNGLFGRGIVVNPADNPVPPLPPAAQRANLALVFDGSGNPIAGAIAGGGVVSSVMQPVTSASSLAIGRTAFGLSTLATEGIGQGLEDDGSANLRTKWTTVQESTGQSVTAAFHGTQRIATGPITYTLARANTYWNGFGFLVDSLSSGGAITFAINAADNFEGGSSGVSLVVGAGARVRLYTDAATAGTWRIEITGGRTPVGNTAYTMTLGDRLVATNAAFTAARTWTLAPAASLPAGTMVTVADEANAVTNTNTLTLAAAGADAVVLRGTTATSLALAATGATTNLLTDGISKWLLLPAGAVSQVFSANGTFITPTDKSFHRVILCGGGGGGGGGGRNATSTATDGGAGGGGGYCHDVTYRTADIGSSQTITIGLGGTAGVGATVNANPGTDGGTGSSSTFGSILTAFGGGAGKGGPSGAGGSTSAGGGGGGPSAAGGISAAGISPAAGGSSQLGVANAAASATPIQYPCNGAATANTAVGSNAQGCPNGGAGGGAGNTAQGGGGNGGDAGFHGPGGGAGGSWTAGNVGSAGGNGGRSAGCPTATIGGAAGNNPGGSTAADFNYHPGCGGAGGGSSAATAAGAGGAGTNGGGGGGGGAGSGVNGGNGGVGGNGFALVISS